MYKGTQILVKKKKVNQMKQLLQRQALTETQSKKRKRISSTKDMIEKMDISAKENVKSE